MIVATVEDTAAGKYVVLECQHPVASGRHIILGGKSRAKLMTMCGVTFVVGQFTDPGELADKVGEHEKTHHETAVPEDTGHHRAIDLASRRHAKTRSPGPR